MINRHAIIVALAAVLQNANAFVPPSPHRCSPRTTPCAAKTAEEDLELTRQAILDHMGTTGEEEAVAAVEETKLIMDIPPEPAPSVETAAAAEKPKPAAAKKAPKKKGHGKEGVFSPIVVAAGAVMGDAQLKKVRAKVISIHSDLIKSFVGTSDSEFGQAVLKQLFNFVDADNSGYLDKEELTVALDMLGFKWLNDKQVDKIFARADDNGDMEISLEEFMEEAPKTLKVNLIKLAKANGDEMGLLV